MLISQKLEVLDNLTDSEKVVANYLIQHIDKVLTLSITTIAKDTYTSPSTTVRLASKLGCNGWKELRLKIIEEQTYINSSNHTVDANIPFNMTDSIQKISSNISKLQVESIYDTLSLLEHDSLQQVVEKMNKAKVINIYGITNTIACSYDFAVKMRSIHRIVNIYDNPEDFPYTVAMSNEDTCSLFIYYTGETPELLEYVVKLKEKLFNSTWYY